MKGARGGGERAVSAAPRRPLRPLPAGRPRPLPSWRPCLRTTCGSSCGSTRPAEPSAPSATRPRRGTAWREYRGPRRERGASGGRASPGREALTRGLSLSRGFTFKKTSPSGGPPREPRGLVAASALREKDVNTSLSAVTSALPAAKDKNTQIQDFFPVVPGGCGVQPGPALARPREASRGPAASRQRSVSEGLRGAPAPRPAAAPVVAIGDDWDDIDDFDLSGIEKKYCRPPVLSPKGQRATPKASQRPDPRLDEPTGSSPGTVGQDTGLRSRGSPEHGETSPAAEQQPSSQQSVICLEDSAPCSGNKAAGESLWEDLSADVILDDDREEGHPGNNLFQSTSEIEENMFVFARRGLDFSEIRGSCMLVSDKQLWVRGFCLGNQQNL